MDWTVIFHDEFDPEFDALAVGIQDALLTAARALARGGPTLGRPLVDTLEGSKFANMKELRFDAADGVWRVAFAFDPRRRAIVLVAGDKSGTAQKRFYRAIIAKADKRYEKHLAELQES